MSYKAYAIYIVIIISVLTISCSKKYLKGTIYMGTGGGFSGNFKEFQLNANGQLYIHQSGIDTVIYLKTVDSSTTKKIFRKYFKLKLDRDDLDAPGNIYTYIGRREGKFRNHKITFGHPEAKVKNEIRSYYSAFMAIINDSTSIKNTSKNHKNAK
jgi:hypothetical protein